MKKYAKLINGELIYSPNKLVVNDVVIYNPNHTTLRNNGYKEVISTTLPQLKWDETILTTYLEGVDNILIEYTITKQEISDEEIDHLRQEEYVRRSDPYLSAYIYYKEKGELDKASEAFQRVEEIKAEIQAKYPKHV